MVQVALATTDDFHVITRHGPMLAQDMRNVVVFPGVAVVLAENRADMAE
jgi:hypothetical protein